MNKIIFVLLSFLLVTTINAQTDFSKGWKKGYKDGFCHNEIGICSPVVPIPPVPPIKNDQNISDYKFGYNEGYIAGTKTKNSAKQNNSNLGSSYKISDETQKTMKEASGNYLPDYSQSQADFRATTNSAAAVIMQQRNANGWKPINVEEGRFMYTYVHNSGLIGMKKLVKKTLEMLEREALINDFEYEVLEVFEHKTKFGVLPKVEVLVKINN